MRKKEHEKKPVEVVNTLTRDQKLDMRLIEIENRLCGHDEMFIEHRQLMLEIKKTLMHINKSKKVD